MSGEKVSDPGSSDSIITVFSADDLFGLYKYTLSSQTAKEKRITYQRSFCETSLLVYVKNLGAALCADILMMIGNIYSLF